TLVPYEPYCFSKDRILLFFYVNDIILWFQKEKRKQADETINQLKKKYRLTGGDLLQWFLGIEVIRDRKRRLIWLSQSDYIDKIVNLIDQKSKREPRTPIRNKELLLNPDQTSSRSINRYQRKIGSILYIAVIIKVDITFPVSR